MARRKKQGMQAHDLVTARRALIRFFIRDVEDAIARRDEQYLSRSSDECMPLPLVIDNLPRDAEKIVIDGLKAALDGKPDPFGIAKPRGISSNYSWGQRHLLAAAALFVSRRDNIDMQAAFEVVAEAAKCPDTTVRDFYYQNEEWAHLCQMGFHDESIKQLLNGVDVSVICPRIDV